MKARSIIIIVGTLIIGIFLGLLTSSLIRHKRIKEFKTYSTPERFIHRFDEILEPTEEQKKNIYPVIEKFARQNKELRADYREEFRALMKDYHNELEPLLTKEQIEKLNEHSWVQSDRNRRKGGPSGKQPGPGDRHDGRYPRDPFFMP